jgi:hypothetical protein
MTCAGCGRDSNAMFTREMKVGANGGMGQSFARSYHLCPKCIELCRQGGAILHIQTMRASGRKMIPRATVGAKTLQWIQAVAKAVQP